MPVLLRTEQIACTADLQVTHGDLEPTTQIRELTDGSESFLRNFLQHLIPLVHKERICRPVAASHAATQLIQL